MFERLDSRFDVLTQVLEALQLGSALSSRVSFAGPSALHYGEETGNRAGFHAVVAGNCWVRLDGTGEHVPISAGDVVVFPHGAGHTLGNHPHAPVIEVGELVGELLPGERAALPGGGGSTVILCGSYSFGKDGGSPLLRGLPDVLHVPGDQNRETEIQAAMQLMAAEIPGEGAGSALVIDRLVDLVFVYALRTWFTLRGSSPTNCWFGALQDPLVGPAISAIHNDPSRTWTVATLAAHAGLSRAAFARRFSAALGEAPLTYVTRWRMSVAADLLEDGERVASVARSVGYDNEFAFTKAFKRVRGTTPSKHRLRHQLGGRR